MQKLVGKLPKDKFAQLQTMVKKYSDVAAEDNYLPEKRFLKDLLDIAKQGALLSVISILNEDVKINYDADYEVESMTVYGNRVQNPQQFAVAIETIKTAVFAELKERYLAKVREYIKKFPDAIESQFLEYLLGKVNKDSAMKDYIEIMEQMSSRLIEVKEGKIFKSSAFLYLGEGGIQHRAADASKFFAACKQLQNFAYSFRQNLGYQKTYYYTPDNNGEITTEAFSRWEGDEVRAGLRHINAVSKPGGTLEDFMRNVKIREHTVFSLLAEILREVFEKSPELKVALEGFPIEEWLQYQSQNSEMTHIDAVNELLKKTGELGSDPLQDKILLIKILQKLDEGLNINCEQLYRAYEKFYNIAATIDDPAAQKLLAQAKKLLLVHSREYRDIVKLQRENYYLKPVIITGKRSSGESVERIFDQRDNRAIIEYVQNYQPKVTSPQDSLLLDSESTQDAITRIVAHLSDPNNRITDTPSLLEDLKLVVARKERMHKSELKVADELLINQVEQCAQKMRELIEQLHANGNDVSDVLAALENLLIERAAVVRENPAKIAVKEELLSIGQALSGNYYGSEVYNAMTVGNEPLVITGTGKQETAITFDEAGAYVRMQVSDSKFLSGSEQIAFDAESGEPYNFLADENQNREQKKDVLIFKASLYLTAEESIEQQTVPAVSAALTELKMVSHSPALIHTARMVSDETKKTEVENPSLSSRV